MTGPAADGVAMPPLRSSSDDTRVLRHQSIRAFLLAGGGIVLTFFSHLVLARVLGARGYGTYTVAFSVIGLLGMVAVLGFHTTLLRFVAEYRTLGQWGELRGLLGFSTAVVAVVGTGIGGLVVAGVAIAAAGDGFSDLHVALLVGVVAIPFLGLNTCRQAALKGLERVVAASVPEWVLRPVLVMLGVGILVAAGVTVSSTSAMGITVAAVVVGFVVGTVMLRRHLPTPVRGAVPHRRIREWLGVSVPMTVVSGLQVVLARTDVILLGALAGPVAAGVYAVAARVATLAALGLTAVTSISPALVSSSHAHGSRHRLQHTLSESVRVVFALTIPLVTGLAVFGRVGLGFFGDEFRAGFVALLILLVGQTVNALAGVAVVALTMTGRQRLVVRVTSLAVLTNIVLDLVLIPGMGLEGAAISTAVSMVGRVVVMWALVRRELGVEASALGLWSSSSREGMDPLP